MVERDTTPEWLANYHSLMRTHGLQPATELGHALARDDRQKPAILTLAQLLEDPALLDRQTREEYPDATSPRLRKALMSVLHQSLALQIISPLVIQLFRDGEGTRLSPERVVLIDQANAESAPDRWQYQTSDEERLSPGAFIQALSHQMTDWYPVFRQHFGVSPGAYWSSVGLALGTPYSLLWDRVDADALCDQASAWLNRFQCDANRYIDWIPAVFNGRRCAIPQRRGCCLKYLLPEGGYCGTCGIYRKERLS
ncbi:(2Fe-2S)-binding protein [Marinobacter sp. VGCF2001]|uniref:(2Fe-2S)-binding protein n=1 Tax=Marinobacter sp. VGCF2001 TaxID=3417189 RepID=UPI003CF52312